MTVIFLSVFIHAHLWFKKYFHGKRSWPWLATPKLVNSWEHGSPARSWQSDCPHSQGLFTVKLKKMNLVFD